MLDLTNIFLQTSLFHISSQATRSQQGRVVTAIQQFWVLKEFIISTATARKTGRKLILFLKKAEADEGIMEILFLVISGRPDSDLLLEKTVIGRATEWSPLL